MRMKFWLLLGLLASPAILTRTVQAQIAGPITCDSAAEGKIIYNDDENVVQFCDGIDWIGMGGGGSSVWADGGPGKIYYDGKVGIGTTTPALAGLQVDTKVGSTAAMFDSGNAGISLVTDWPGLYFNSYFDGGWKFMGAGYAGMLNFNPTKGDAYFALSGASGAAGTAAAGTTPLYLKNNGNVGIGTTTPGTDVGMIGGITVNGTGGTQITIQKDGTSGFALNISQATAGDWIMHDKVGGGWNQSLRASGGKIHFRPNCREVVGPTTAGVSYATCAADEFVMSGGGWCQNGSIGYLHYSGPEFGANRWGADCYTHTGGDTSATAKAVCCKAQ